MAASTGIRISSSMSDSANLELDLPRLMRQGDGLRPVLETASGCRRGDDLRRHRCRVERSRRQHLRLVAGPEAPRAGDGRAGSFLSDTAKLTKTEFAAICRPAKAKSGPAGRKCPASRRARFSSSFRFHRSWMKAASSLSVASAISAIATLCVGSADLARVRQRMAMGEMAASIAHEIKQPLAAIATNANAGLRWLGNSQPDLAEVRIPLKRVVDDCHRADEVINGIRLMFRKNVPVMVPLDINGLVRNISAILCPDCV